MNQQWRSRSSLYTCPERPRTRVGAASVERQEVARIPELGPAVGDVCFWASEELAESVAALLMGRLDVMVVMRAYGCTVLGRVKFKL